MIKGIMTEDKAELLARYSEVTVRLEEWTEESYSSQGLTSQQLSSMFASLGAHANFIVPPAALKENTEPDKEQFYQSVYLVLQLQQLKEMAFDRPTILMMKANPLVTEEERLKASHWLTCCILPKGVKPIKSERSGSDNTHMYFKDPLNKLSSAPPLLVKMLQQGIETKAAPHKIGGLFPDLEIQGCQLGQLQERNTDSAIWAFHHAILFLLHGTPEMREAITIRNGRKLRSIFQELGILPNLGQQRLMSQQETDIADQIFSLITSYIEGILNEKKDDWPENIGQLRERLTINDCLNLYCSSEVITKQQLKNKVQQIQERNIREEQQQHILEDHRLLNFREGIRFKKNSKSLYQLAQEPYFVDKSLFIAEVFAQQQNALITRPFRWGKTTNLLLLKQFLSVRTVANERQRMLFYGGQGEFGNYKKLRITNEKHLMAEFGQWPVIYLDLNEFICEEFPYQTFHAPVKNAYKEHLYLGLHLKKLADQNNEQYSQEHTNFNYFKQIQGQSENIRSYKLNSSLELLAKLLFAFWKKQCFVLIDGFDCLANQSLKYSKQIQTSICQYQKFLIAKLSKSQFVKRIVAVGTIPYSKSSQMQYCEPYGFEIFPVSGTDTRFSHSFGFTEDDVDALLEETTTNNWTIHKKTIRAHCNRYNAAGSAIYSPSSILQFLENSRQKQQIQTSVLSNQKQTLINLPCFHFLSSMVQLIQSIEALAKFEKVLQTQFLNKAMIFQKEIDFQILINGIFLIASLDQIAKHNIYSQQTNRFWNRADAIFIPIADKSQFSIIHEYKVSKPKQVDEMIESGFWQILQKQYVEYPLLTIRQKRNFCSKIITRVLVFYKTRKHKWSLKTKQYIHSIPQSKNLSKFFKTLVIVKDLTIKQINQSRKKWLQENNAKTLFQLLAHQSQSTNSQISL